MFRSLWKPTRRHVRSDKEKNWLGQEFSKRALWTPTAFGNASSILSEKMTSMVLIALPASLPLLLVALTIRARRGNVVELQGGYQVPPDFKTQNPQCSVHEITYFLTWIKFVTYKAASIRKIRSWKLHLQPSPYNGRQCVYLVNAYHGHCAVCVCKLPGVFA